MTPIIIKGNYFIDERGKLILQNNFNLSKIKRFYIIEQPDMNVVRAWQGHKIETKWFYVIKGSFSIGYVSIDNFIHPSENLKANYINLKEEENIVFNIPFGYANGLKALEPNSKVMVFSDLTLDQAKDDIFKFESNLWLDWNNLSL